MRLAPLAKDVFTMRGADWLAEDVASTLFESALVALPKGADARYLGPDKVLGGIHVDRLILRILVRSGVEAGGRLAGQTIAFEFGARDDRKGLAGETSRAGRPHTIHQPR